MKIWVFVFSLCFLPSLSLSSVQAASTGDVLINEIAWTGTTNSANDEWIELYNNTGSPISLGGWQLTARDGTPKINLSGTVPANGFYLLERTDDTTIPDVPADQIYTGALENTGETLELFDNSGNLIDRVNNSSGWFASDNNTKQTMERKTNGNWQTSQGPGGTPKAKNSQGEISPKLSLTETKPGLAEQDIKKEMAAVGEPIFPFLMALAMAIFSVVIILILKKRLKSI